MRAVNIETNNGKRLNYVLKAMDYFGKVLVTNLLTKVAQKFGDFLGNFKVCRFSVKATLATFTATFGKTLGHFLF